MIFGLLTVGLMLLVNAIFAAYEMALATITKARVMMLVHLNKKGAQETLFMKERMEGSLAVVQLGITFAGAIAAAIGGLGVNEHLSPLFKVQWHMSDFMADMLSLIFLVIPLTCMTIIFSELIPKTYAIKHHDRVCLTLSPLMKFLSIWAYPVIRILEGIVKKSIVLINRGQPNQAHEEQAGLHELNAAVAMARTSRLLGAGQERILLSAAQLSIRTVKEIMLPISEVCTISLQSSLTEALIRAHQDMHTRFPVCTQEHDLQTIEGYINFKDIMAGLKLNPNDPSIKGIVRTIKRVQVTTMISQVLEQMISEKLHIALVVSSEGKTVGMVTLEDILEELVGEIEDEFDRIPSYIHPYGSSGWLMGGGTIMTTVAQVTGENLNLTASEEKLKLADWFASKISQPLVGGETMNINNLQFMARKLRRNKLGEAAILRITAT
jgi:putative hemolysin